MVKVGETLYDMRVVKTYHGQDYEERPLFNGFEGIVVWSTWDTGDWQVLQCRMEDGKYQKEEIGYIEYDGLNSDKTGEEIANLIKEQVKQFCAKRNKTEEYKVTVEQVRQALLTSNTVAPRNVSSPQHIPKKSFDELVKWTTDYVNEQIAKVQIQSKVQPSIAIDETIAQIIQIRDKAL